MFRYVFLLCLVGASLALPTRSREEVESFRRFLLDARPYNASSLEERMAKYPWMSAWENSGKYQGDIVVPDFQVDELVDAYAHGETNARNGLSTAARLWPAGQIPFQFSGSFSASNRNLILGVMTLYHQRTCVRFRERTNEVDFVRITPQNDGCYANVGYYRNMGPHIHNLAPSGCMNQFIIFHEFGHNVGFNHMHQARVRNEWVIINLNNVVSGMEHNFNLVAVSASNMLGLNYEYASNQHYGPTAFARASGLRTIEPRHAGGNQMGQLNRVTEWDFLRVNRLYNCPGAWTRESESEANTLFEMPSIEELEARGAAFAAEEAERLRREGFVREDQA